MSDPLAECLRRFTPDAAGLARDALLFRAGRASARPGRGWVALAGALALSQALTLALLWPRSTPPAGRGGREPVSGALVEQLPPDPPADGAELGSLWRRLLEDEGDLPAPAVGDALVPDGPPLRAFAGPSTSLPD